MNREILFDETIEQSDNGSILDMTDIWLSRNRYIKRIMNDTWINKR